MLACQYTANLTYLIYFGKYWINAVAVRPGCTVAGSQQDLYEMTLYRLRVDNSFGSCSPNVEIALKIYLTLMVTNCSGERSFPKLTRLKK